MAGSVSVSGLARELGVSHVALNDYLRRRWPRTPEQSHARWRLTEEQLIGIRAHFAARAASHRSGGRFVAPDPGSRALADAVVLGCVSGKRTSPAPARDFYDSPLWARRRRYAESSGAPWFIFSAEHGLIDPGRVIAPYDRRLHDADPAEARALGEEAADRLQHHLGALTGRTVEIRAGAAYVRALGPALTRRGALVRWPLRGLSLGEQLRWYDTRDGGDDVAKAAAREVGDTEARASDPIGEVAIIGMERLGSFTYRWPTDVETFAKGWDLLVRAGERTYKVRHGIGSRVAYGRERARTVTWVGAWPKVEGVGEDDYAESGLLLSLLRVEGGRMVDYQEQLPAGYAGFDLVRFADRISGPHARRKLAVRLTEDDLLGWSRHALLRLASQALRSAKAAAPAPPPAPVMARLTAPPSIDQQAVAASLLRFGDTAPMDDERGEPRFTENPEANRFIATDAFAFLLAVIFDQGIVAERAWAAPYRLRERLGHLDPARMVAEPDKVAGAVGTPPKLHRYVEKMPGWLVSAAERVLTEYRGDAARIWDDQPTAAELQKRFDAFEGIGQKKAAMAVAILARDLHKPIRELGGNDVAYDVHIRRVFLRTGLAQHDDDDEMIAVARQLSPSQPAKLDLPAWVIGRTWCRPGVPSCPGCPLIDACPRLTKRAAGVLGA